MPRVAGITIESTLRGKPQFARINLSKHPEFIPMLEEKGVIEPIPNAQTLSAIKEAEHPEKLKTYTSVDELFKDLENGI